MAIAIITRACQFQQLLEGPEPPDAPCRGLREVVEEHGERGEAEAQRQQGEGAAAAAQLAEVRE